MSRTVSKLKVSVIIPVRNEEKNIGPLFDSLCSQSRLPDEVVLTDGGSTDGTLALISRHAASAPFPVNVIRETHAFPGRGRNLAAARARHEIIAMTDAGIILDKDWLRRIVEPFERDRGLQLVFGVQGCTMHTLFERCFSIVYVSAGLDRDPGFAAYPFLGSLAIRREAWESTGGFREDVRAAEDKLFFRTVARLGLKTIVEKKAIAYWRPRSSLSEAFPLSFQYARCDFLVGMERGRYARKGALYLAGAALFAAGFAHPVFWLGLAAGFTANLLLVCRKHRDEFLSVVREHPSSILRIAVIVLVLDAGGLLGYASGAAALWNGKRGAA